ncbi:MAG: hypothetical protein K9M07_01245 [Simkaniaceae bacterium]|nr:hypothetical protein [Simkaniaceae bacterium]
MSAISGPAPRGAIIMDSAPKGKLQQFLNSDAAKTAARVSAITLGVFAIIAIMAFVPGGALAGFGAMAFIYFGIPTVAVSALAVAASTLGLEHLRNHRGTPEENLPLKGDNQGSIN